MARAIKAAGLDDNTSVRRNLRRHRQNRTEKIAAASKDLGCDKSARNSSRLARVGYKRCEELGCEKNARDSTGRCKGHGGGKRCEEPRGVTRAL